MKRETTGTPTLAAALEENKDVKVRVESAASDLASASEVLEADIADGDAELAARVALKVSKEVEDKVQECADDLYSVNATLAQGVAALEHTQDALLATLALPVVFEGLQIVVRPSIGISLYPEHGKSAFELISSADAAMYAAKKSGGSPGGSFMRAHHRRALSERSCHSRMADSCSIALESTDGNHASARRSSIACRAFDSAFFAARSRVPNWSCGNRCHESMLAPGGVTEKLATKRGNHVDGIASTSARTIGVRTS